RLGGSMTERLYVGTRKGLFELAPQNDAWDIVATHFLGDPVSAVLAQGDTTYAALDLGHFGAKLWRRGGAGAWRGVAAPGSSPGGPFRGGGGGRPTTGILGRRARSGLAGRAVFPGGWGPAQCRAASSVRTTVASHGR